MRDLLSTIKNAKAVIEEVGFAVLTAQLGPDLDPYRDGVYTLGLAKQGLPELVVFGMSYEVGSKILATLGQIQVAQGPFTHGREIGSEVFKEGAPYKLIMAEIDEAKAREFFMVDQVLYGPELKITGMQVCWPDAAGKFPWEEGSTLGETTRLGRKPL